MEQAQELLLKRLKTFKFLHGVEQETLGELAANAAWQVYRPDAVIFWEGDIENLPVLPPIWLD